MNTLSYIEHKTKQKNDNLSKDLKNINWEKSKELNPMDWMPRLYKKLNDYYVSGSRYHLGSFEIDNEYNEGNNKHISISYSKNFEPDIIKFQQGTHDGTLIFVYEIIGNIFEDLLLGTTYSNENQPENYSSDNEFFKYNVRYTIGDLLWNTKFVDHVDEKNGKMFLGETDSFAMAVKVEYIKKTE